MKLKQLLDKIYKHSIDKTFLEQDIRDIGDDSRQVAPQSLFIARRGYRFDGSQFVQEAIDKGAVVVAGEENQKNVLESWPQDVCYLKVKDINQFLSQIVERFYGQPSKKMQLIGVTGTNGKTTVTYFIESVFKQAKRKCGVIGTINYRAGETLFASSHTTPGIIENQKLLYSLCQQDIHNCVMEVSSHALEQGRVDLLDFDRAVFTNITSDHIDYHLNQENYFKAKSKLFSGLSKKATAIINADDSFAQKLISLTKANILTFGIKETCDYQAVNIKIDLKGAEFDVKGQEGDLNIKTNMVGMHNVYNILAAVVTCLSLDFDPGDIQKGITSLTCVPGRLEVIDCGQDFHIFVDYAHTEDGLRNVLTAIKDIHKGRVIVIFGCGGDRDKTKRSQMGKVASELAEYVILTSDNPRNEDPQSILDDIVSGIEKDVYTVIPDRMEAIRHAIDVAETNDVVLIAGKGHEDYQAFKSQTIHFDDREAARTILSERIKC